MSKTRKYTFTIQLQTLHRHEKKQTKNYDETNNSHKKYIRKKGKILVEHNKKYRPTQLDEEPS